MEAETPDRPGKRTATGLPKPPGMNLNPGEFLDYIRKFEARDWSHVEIYVYAPWPVLLEDRTPKYIDKISQCFDETYLLQEHGSGDYYFSLNDTDIRGTKRTVACVPKARPLSLRDPAYPPKRHLEQIAWSDPANKSLKDKLIREGKMTATGEVIQPATSGSGDAGVLKDAFLELLRERRQPQQSAPEQAVLTRTLDMMQNASSKSIEIALSQVRQESPESFLKLFGLIKDLMGDKSSGSNDKLLELVMKQNADLQKHNGELMLKLIDQKPKSLSDTVEEFRALKEVFGGGDEGPSARSPLGKWGALVEALAPAAPALLSTLGSFFRPPMLPHQAGAPLPPGAPPPYQPPPGPPASNPTTAPAGQPGAPDAHQLPAPPADPNVNPAVVQQLVSFLPIVDAVIANYINQGRSGDEFAEWLADSYGEIAYNQVRSAGPDNLNAALRHSQQLAAIAQAAPVVWEQFIADFMNPPAQVEDPPADPAPPPSAEPRKKQRERKAAA